MNNSLAEVHPELVSEWSEKNLLLTPDDITFGSNKKVWWKGACSHEDVYKRQALFVTFRLTTPARPPLANPAPKPPLPLPPFALTLVELLFLPPPKLSKPKASKYIQEVDNQENNIFIAKRKFYDYYNSWMDNTF